MPPRVPRRAVAALFIERQHLDRPLGRRLTRANLTRFAEDVGGIQLDSINVVERAHHLTLWNRFGPFDRRAFERLAYRRRVMFEYWAHAACLVPVGDFASWRRAMLDYSSRNRGWSRFLRRHRRTIAAVESAIRERGVLGNADFARPAANGRKASGWWNWRPTTHALDYLWMSGRTMVHSRVHFQKRFDLAERVLPDAALLEPVSREAFGRWHLRRSLHAMGAATETDLRVYLSFPRIPRGERLATLRAAIAEGEVTEIEVAGDRGRWLALTEDLPALARAGRRRQPARGTALLAPFDSFLWHRERTERLFGYEYRIEVYTPGPKRVHGYYTLPIYHDGLLIGRLDPKTHREAGRLEVRNVHFEPWFAKGEPPPAAAWGAVDRDAALAGVATALRSLATFVGAGDVTIGRVSPASLGAALKKALA
ncbi:MAG: YcaQ family DNA glycosylase [Candidatus Eisenbacteria bacterium]|nr:YcaQ family DNA glycosylase [Candidatus Eisenbacteria bacterium]